MQNCLLISKSDLIYNAKSIIEQVKAPVIAVLKCNGYGVGFENALNAWYNCGVRFFAVSQPLEALYLRELGYDDIEILLMSPVYDKEIIEKLLLNKIILTVTSYDCALNVATFSGDLIPRVHVKVDTGMGRFGLRWDDLVNIKEIYSVEGLSFEGIFSHLALSFEKKYSKTKIQLDRFLSVCNYLSDNNINFGIRHLANSVAAIKFEQTRLDAVRIGSALVGRLVCKTQLSLKAIGKMNSQVVELKKLKKGDSTGYASICRLKKDCEGAVIAMGFSTGFGVKRRDDSFRFIDILRSIYHSFKSYKKQPSVYYNGTRLNVIGRIGNQFTIIETKNSGLKVGDCVFADVNLLLVPTEIERCLTD